MIFLCGKGEGAAAILRANVQDGLEMCVFSPDPLVQALAAQAGLLWTGVSVNQHHLWPGEPDLIVSCGYLDIVTPAVIERAKGRVINCHYALLPNHRGRSAVPWAIVDGDTCTGVTWHWIDEGIDTGAMLLQAACQIDYNETQATLFRKMDRLACESFPAALRLALAGLAGMTYRGRVQYHRAGPPHGGVIDPRWDDAYVERFIRAMTYPPLPYAKLDGVEVTTFAEYWQVKRERHDSYPV